MVLLLIPAEIVVIAPIDAIKRSSVVRTVRGRNDFIEIAVGDDLIAGDTHDRLLRAFLQDFVNPFVLLLRSLVPMEIDPLRFGDGFCISERLRIDTH